MEFTTMKTVLYMPDDRDETRGLLAETGDAVLMDGRTRDIPLALRNVPPNQDRSPNEEAARVWRDVLPGTTSEWLEARVRLGWTEAEILEISGLVAATGDALSALADAAVLDGTRATCRRQAEALHTLRTRWLTLLD